MAKSKKQNIAAAGSWLPIPLEFLKSRALAELSPIAAKLLFDVLALLGRNCIGNGDLSLAPKRMAARGWTSRSSLAAAVLELLEHGIIFRTRHGSRLDCSLFACTLYPLDCDLKKIEERPGCYRQSEYMGDGASLAAAPTEINPARWRRARPAKMISVAPLRDDMPEKRPAAGRTARPEAGK